MEQPGDRPTGHTPFVGENTNMREFTIRALVLGLMMTVVLGAANAYLGLRAGMTIAATYPAAVVGMAVLRLFRGSILEENFARTVGSIGESVAAGAIFTIPAFVIAGIWSDFGDLESYLLSAAMMFTGGMLGILFVSVLRRVMVEDVELPFPESTAAAEIHKAGRSGGSDAKLLFSFIGVGALVQLLGKIKAFATSNNIAIPLGSTQVSLNDASGELIANVKTSGTTLFATPAVSPAYMGVGFIIGPRLASLNFAGGLLAWGLFVPLLTYMMGPSLEASFVETHPEWTDSMPWHSVVGLVWKNLVRPIAVGGMLVGAAFTLYRMRRSLGQGVARAARDVRKAAGSQPAASRLDKDLDFRIVLVLLAVVMAGMFGLYWLFSESVGGAIVSALVMAVTGFFFAAVSGYLVGTIGSSNNPVSGLTVSTLIIAGLLMVAIGVSGKAGIAAVLGVAAVICVSSAVAGEMLQDLKVGHILGGTPWKMETGNLIGVLVASAVLFFPLVILHQGDIKMGGEGFGGPNLPAPQAGLMAMLAEGIVTQTMAWPLVIVGIVMGIALILVRVQSPMLVAVGMYLPLETTFAIFLGGGFRWILDRMAERRGMNDGQKTRIGNAGVLVAAGLIAGEALMGLGIAGMAFFDVPIPGLGKTGSPLLGYLVLVAVGAIMVRVPLRRAGRPDDAPPPTAVV
jgi:putative OPT family oligopeptide transporter